MVLGIKVKASPELLIRDVVIANDKGEITCAAEIPEGSALLNVRRSGQSYSIR